MQKKIKSIDISREKLNMPLTNIKYISSAFYHLLVVKLMRRSISSLTPLDFASKGRYSSY